MTIHTLPDGGDSDTGDRIRAREQRWARVPRWILRTLGKDTTAITVYCWLGTYAREGNGARPFQASIADDADLGIRTVERAFARLRTAGLLASTPRLHKGRKVGNDYVLAVDEPVTGDGSVDVTEPSLTTVHRTVTDDGSLSFLEQSNRTDARADARDPTLDAEFDQIWTSYPRKLNRKGALRAYRATRRRGVPVEQLVVAVEHYAAAMTAERRESEHILHGATFFGPSERWTDYVEPPAPKPTNGQAPVSSWGY